MNILIDQIIEEITLTQFEQKTEKLLQEQFEIEKTVIQKILNDQKSITVNIGDQELIVQIQYNEQEHMRSKIRIQEVFQKILNQCGNFGNHKKDINLDAKISIKKGQEQSSTDEQWESDVRRDMREWLLNRIQESLRNYNLRLSWGEIKQKISWFAELNGKQSFQKELLKNESASREQTADISILDDIQFDAEQLTITNTQRLLKVSLENLNMNDGLQGMNQDEIQREIQRLLLNQIQIRYHAQTVSQYEFKKQLGNVILTQVLVGYLGTDKEQKKQIDEEVWLKQTKTLDITYDQWKSVYVQLKREYPRQIGQLSLDEIQKRGKNYKKRIISNVGGNKSKNQCLLKVVLQLIDIDEKKIKTKKQTYEPASIEHLLYLILGQIKQSSQQVFVGWRWRNNKTEDWKDIQEKAKEKIIESYDQESLGSATNQRSAENNFNTLKINNGTIYTLIGQFSSNLSFSNLKKNIKIWDLKLHKDDELQIIAYAGSSKKSNDSAHWFSWKISNYKIEEEEDSTLQNENSKIVTNIYMILLEKVATSQKYISTQQQLNQYEMNFLQEQDPAQQQLEQNKTEYHMVQLEGGYILSRINERVIKTAEGLAAISKELCIWREYLNL